MVHVYHTNSYLAALEHGLIFITCPISAITPRMKSFRSSNW